MELVNNKDENKHCADYSDDTPWVEFRLWGYNVNTKTHEYRCHFCMTIVNSPKPFESVCGTESCQALWTLMMMDRKKFYLEGVRT